MSGFDGFDKFFCMRLHWFGLLIVAVAGWVLVHDITAWKDVEFGDETTYLGSGLTFAIPFIGGVQWGPLYAAWYAFEHLFVPDSLDLYYANWAILSVLAGLGVFVWFRSLRLSAGVSAWLGVLFLFSNQNLPLNPKISIAPFCLILGTLALIHIKAWPQYLRFLLVAFTGLICSYIRPEFYVSFLCGTAIALGWLWNDTSTAKRWAGWGGSFVVGSVALHLLFGNPLFGGDDSRSAVAFQQHFVVNYSAWNRQPEPSTIEAQLKLFHEVLGNNVETFADALKKQPKWTLKHVFTNITHTLSANVQNGVDTFYQTLLRGWYSRWRIVVVGLVALLFAASLDYRRTFQNFRKLSIDFWGLVAVLVLLLPSLIATVLIYPRTHYLVFHLILIFWLLAQVVKPIAWRKIPILSYLPQGALALGALLVFVGVRYSSYSQPIPTPIADNIRFIKAIQPSTRLRVLERDWYRVFLKEESDWIHVEEYTLGNFTEFVKSKNINFILMTQDMQAYFAKDAGFQEFLKNHASLGFEKRLTNSTGDYLLIKQTLKP